MKTAKQPNIYYLWLVIVLSFFKRFKENKLSLCVALLCLLSSLSIV